MFLLQEKLVCIILYIARISTVPPAGNNWECPVCLGIRAHAFPVPDSLVLQTTAQSQIILLYYLKLCVLFPFLAVYSYITGIFRKKSYAKRIRHFTTLGLDLWHVV